MSLAVLAVPSRVNKALCWCKLEMLMMGFGSLTAALLLTSYDMTRPLQCVSDILLQRVCHA